MEMAKNKKLVLAFFENKEAADKAAKELKAWDDAVAGIKFDSIGVLVKDDKGKVKTQVDGHRHTGLGIALGALAGVLTGGLSLIGGALIGGVLGHFVQNGLGMSKEDLKRIGGELDGGKAAVAVLVPEGEETAVMAWVKELGGVPEAHEVTDEGAEAAAAAIQADEASIPNEPDAKAPVA
jgi:uncharacterized membrane protein